MLAVSSALLVLLSLVTGGEGEILSSSCGVLDELELPSWPSLLALFAMAAAMRFCADLVLDSSSSESPLEGCLFRHLRIFVVWLVWDA